MNIIDLCQKDGLSLRYHAANDGGEWVGPCPFCGQGDDRFHVWPKSGNYWCRFCGKKGDAIQYLRERRGLSFQEAQQELGGGGGERPQRKAQTKMVGEKRWTIRTADWLSQAEHVRTDFSDGSKTFRWEPSGIKSPDMDFYHGQALDDLDTGSLVVVTEGEKACDAVNASFADFVAVGTVCGAHSIPCEAVLSRLLGHSVVLWPDNDEPGKKHMAKIAGWLTQHDAPPRWVDWSAGPMKSDAADYPDSIAAIVENANTWEAPAVIDFPATNQPFQHVGLGYSYGPPGYDVRIMFDYLQRRGMEIVAEVDTEATIPGHRPGRIQRGRVTLTSGASKAGHARLLTSLSSSEIPWHRFIEEACDMVVDAERDGEAGMRIGRREKPSVPEDRWLIDHMVPEGKVTLWYGSRASCKSQTAALMATCLQLGKRVFGRNVKTTRVGVLDYEDDDLAWEEYLQSIARGLGVDAPEIFYRPCRVPLRQQVNTIARMGDSEGIDLWIVDSFGLAGGPAGQASSYEEIAISFGAVTREIGKSWLVIDHISNEARRNPKVASDPYGSQYKMAIARAGFEVRKEQEEGEHQAHIGIFDRKHRRLKAIGQLATWQADGRLTFEAEDLRLSDTDMARQGISLADRLRGALQHGQLAVEDLVEVLGAKPDVIRMTLNRGRRSGAFYKNDETGEWGIGEGRQASV